MKKSLFQNAFIFFVILACQSLAHSQTLHTIVFADTYDENRTLSIGIEKTKNDFIVELEVVADNLGIPISFHIFEGRRFSNNALQSVLDKPVQSVPLIPE